MTFLNAKNNLSNNTSIAVLPFVNMSSDINNEYFSDGITEEIINALTKVSGLKVISRTSSFAFKNKNIDVRKVGKQLGVATLLEGSVRKSQNRVRITAQLINTNNATHYWSKNFDRELIDIFKLQDEISLLIADQIRENFGHLELQDHLVNKSTNNIKAYEFYLKGRQLQLNWNLEDINNAIKLYKQCIEIDAAYSDAYVAIGWCYGILATWGFMDRNEGNENAGYYLSKGSELNNSSYMAFFAKATIVFWGKWNCKEGLNYLDESLKINPNFSDALEAKAEIYTALGLWKNALEVINEAININPLSPNHYYTKGIIYYLQVDYSTAIKFMDKAIRLDVNFALAIQVKLACYLFLNKRQELEAYLNDQYNLFHLKPIILTLFYKINKLKIPNELLKATLEIEINENELIPWWFYDVLYKKDSTTSIKLLIDKVETRSGQFINFKNDPFLSPLRSHPNFKELEDNMLNYKLPLQKNSNTSTKKKLNLLTKVERIKYKNTLEDVLNDEQAYLLVDLSLKSLADTLKLHPNKLSWLLNFEYDKNFNDFINQYRLAHFKTIALNPKFKHITILGLAYDSGFNSKSVFNTYFKKMEGVTPSQWVKMNK